VQHPSSATLAPSRAPLLAIPADAFGESVRSGARARARFLSCLLGSLRRERAQVSLAVWRKLGLLGYAHAQARRTQASSSHEATQAYLVALATNLPLRRAMQECGYVLARAGVRAIVYKGQEYLDRIYRDPGARPMADVDLLVQPEDADRAEAALVAAGYVVDDTHATMHERKLVKNGVAVDLHRSLMQAGRAAIEQAEFFARALPCEAAPGLLVLEATDALLSHCIAQTVKAYRVPASSYLELQALFDAADAEEALARARRYRLCSALYASLRVLGALGHAAARSLCHRVPLSLARRACLDALSSGFALGGVSRVPRSALLLASKAALIDDMRRACGFVLQWCVFQLAGPRVPAAP
jgi:hypothetical protein